jgi:hypothetical protein
MKFALSHRVAALFCLPGSIAKLTCLLPLVPVFLLSACDHSDRLSYQPDFSASPSSTTNEYVFGMHPQRN